MDFFKVIMTSKAQSDLAECVGFALNVSKDAVQKLADNIYSSIQSLQTFPERNAIFEMPKSFPFVVRKLIIGKRYVALYVVEEKQVVVYRILDSRRKFNYLIGWGMN